MQIEYISWKVFKWPPIEKKVDWQCVHVSKTGLGPNSCACCYCGHSPNKLTKTYWKLNNWWEFQLDRMNLTSWLFTKCRHAREKEGSVIFQLLTFRFQISPDTKDNLDTFFSCINHQRGEQLKSQLFEVCFSSLTILSQVFSVSISLIDLWHLCSRPRVTGKLAEYIICLSSQNLHRLWGRANFPKKFFF